MIKMRGGGFSLRRGRQLVKSLIKRDADSKSTCNTNRLLFDNTNSSFNNGNSTFSIILLAIKGLYIKGIVGTHLC